MTNLDKYKLEYELTGNRYINSYVIRALLKRKIERVTTILKRK